MLGRIATVTINTPDISAAVAAYQRYLGYRAVHDGALGRDEHELQVLRNRHHAFERSTTSSMVPAR